MISDLMISDLMISDLMISDLMISDLMISDLICLIISTTIERESHQLYDMVSKLPVSQRYSTIDEPQ